MGVPKLCGGKKNAMEFRFSKVDENHTHVLIKAIIYSCLTIQPQLNSLTFSAIIMRFFLFRKLGKLTDFIFVHQSSCILKSIAEIINSENCINQGNYGKTWFSWCIRLAPTARIMAPHERHTQHCRILPLPNAEWADIDKSNWLFCSPVRLRRIYSLIVEPDTLYKSTFAL